MKTEKFLQEHYIRLKGIVPNIEFMATDAELFEALISKVKDIEDLDEEIQSLREELSDEIENRRELAEELDEYQKKFVEERLRVKELEEELSKR